VQPHGGGHHEHGNGEGRTTAAPEPKPGRRGTDDRPRSPPDHGRGS
jgi:hypothetical protein